MNKKQKEVIQAQLDAEKAVLEKLEKQYQKALSDINQKVKLFDADIKSLDVLLNTDGLDDTRKATLESMKQAKIYQKQYQEALKKQIAGILDKLHGDTYATVEQYLKECYKEGYLGTMYDIQGQGVPIVVPIDQEAVAQAVVLDSKVVEGYYNALGVDFDRLKKVIPAEVSRGIASSLPYIDIARNINNASKSGLYNAYRIVRTEGHRIQQTATYDAQKAAKARGADVVKQWDSTLDGRTRPTHKKLDGQIREVDEPFEVDGKKAMKPGDFGRPEEDINCRCVSLTRARWDLDADETKYLGDTKNMTDADLEPIANKLHIPVDELRKYSNQIIPVKAKDFDDFNRQYKNIWNYEGSELQKENRARIESYKFSDKIKTTAANGLEVKKASIHTLERAEERGVYASGIVDALNNPLHVGEVVTDEKGRKSQRFIGESTTVNVNPDTGVVTTVWKTGRTTKKKYQKEK